ncbi:FAD-binding oxidoreductase [Geodermatophilus amargosae]|uniref:FAD-binding oxidoreductase n=1 Tax=Geodermatophilus amargosae TaxID=1296565 RepID=UPI0034DF048E
MTTLPVPPPPLPDLLGDPRPAVLPPDLTAALSARLSPSATLSARSGVQVAEVSDVVAALRLAGRHGVPVTVGGPGRVDDGAARRLVVDPGGLAGVSVSPAGWARVGAGVRWRTLAEAAAPHGLTPITGGSAAERVADTVTGGGVGPLARTYGLAADRVRAVELVTGDGVLRRVTPTDEADLYWGVRGGGAALGVVTAVELDLLAAGPRYGGALHWAEVDAARVAGAWRTWSAGLPPQAGTSLLLTRPQEGDGAVTVRFAWSGEADDGDALLDGLRAAAPPSRTDLAPRGPAGLAAPGLSAGVESSLLLDRLSAVDALLRATAGSRPRTVEVRLLGGALGWVPQRPSAVCHRDARLAVRVAGGAGVEDRAATRACAEELAAALGADVGGRAPAHGWGTTPDVLARTPTAAVRDRLAALAAATDPHRILEGAAPGGR